MVKKEEVKKEESGLKQTSSYELRKRKSVTLSKEDSKKDILKNNSREDPEKSLKKLERTESPNVNKRNQKYNEKKDAKELKKTDSF